MTDANGTNGVQWHTIDFDRCKGAASVLDYTGLNGGPCSHRTTRLTHVHLAMRVAIFHQGRLFEQRRNPLGNQVQMVRGDWHERQAAEEHRLFNETQRSSRAREFEILLASGAELAQDDIIRLHAVRDNFSDGYIYSARLPATRRVG